MLQCGHCFCLDCIHILLNEFSFGGAHRNVKCPVCRQSTAHIDVSYVNLRASKEVEGQLKVQASRGRLGVDLIGSLYGVCLYFHIINQLNYIFGHQLCMVTINIVSVNFLRVLTLGMLCSHCCVECSQQMFSALHFVRCGNNNFCSSQCVICYILFKSCFVIHAKKQMCFF